MSSAGGTPLSAGPSRVRLLAIGCFMAWIGALSGAMVAVLVAKGAAFFMKAPACDGIPTCDWYIYAAVGACVGFLTLPWLVVSALRRPLSPLPESSDDKN